MKKIKGISPLVATVLLIAITMTIAGMLAYWATTFVGTRLPENVTVIECTGANFRVFDCRYNATSNTLDVVLQNIGGVSIRNLTIFIFYANNTIYNFPLNESLGAAQIKSYRLNDVSSDYSRFTITTPCPGIEVTTTCGR